MATAEIIDDEALGGDDMDDWSAVPAYKKKKVTSHQNPRFPGGFDLCYDT